MMLVTQEIEQSCLVDSQKMELLIQEWNKTHLYAPESLGEILQEALE